MSKFLARKWLRTGVLWSLLLPVLLLMRYRSGAHYLPVCVQLSEDLLRYGHEAKVHVISPFGSSRVLKPESSNPRLFRSPDFFLGAVTHICITGVEPSFSDYGTLRLVTGTSQLGLAGSHSLSLQPAAVEQVEKIMGSPCAVYGDNSQSASFLKIPSQCMNWQGDFWLVVLCGVQAGVLVLLLKLVEVLFRAAYEAGPGHIEIRRGRVVGLVKSFFLLVMVLLLAHQLWVQVWQLFCIPDAIEQFMGLSLVCIAGILIWKLARGEFGSRISGPTRGIAACFGIVLLLVVRVVVSGNWPWYQTGDYATYWDLGGRMAAGEWETVRNGFYLNRTMVLRAAMYAFPFRVLSGDSATRLFIINSACLLGAACLIYMCLREIWGRRTAVVAAVLFSLSPDILFGGHLCRHDNPAMLYLAVVVLLMGKLQYQGDCATLGNLRYFGKKSACLDLRLLNRHEDAAYGENR